jgi:HK97 family phage major capsid protein
MQKLREMLDKRNALITSARALVDKADAEKRSLTTEEKVTYDKTMADAVDLRSQMDTRQALIDEEKRMAEESLKRTAEGKDKPKTPEAEARQKAFRSFLRDDRSMTEEEKRGLTTGSDTQAGFLNAPQEFVQQLIQKVKNIVFIEGLSTGHTTTNANGLGFPTLEDDLADFEMITEIKTAPEDTTLSFGKREFKPHPSSKLVKISDAMLRADGMNPEAIVMDRASYKYAVLKENKYLLGTGNQEPLGLFVASAKGINTDRDVTMAYNDDFSADDILNAKYAVKAQYMSKAAWLFNRTAVLKLAKIKDGTGRYLFEMTDKIGAMDQLKGSPLYMSEYVPNTFSSSQYVGMFGDFSWYYTVNSLSLRVKRLNELFAATRQVGFLFDTEFDGMPVLPEAFARIKTGTVSATA